MPEQMADRGQVNPRFEQGDSSAVPHAVRMEPLLVKGRRIFGGELQTFYKDVANPEAGQRRASVLTKTFTSERMSKFLALQRARSKAAVCGHIGQ